MAVALPVIRAYASGGERAVQEYLEKLVYGVKAGLLLTASRNITELRGKPILISQTLDMVMRQRGIDPKIYMNATRAMKGWC